MEVVEDVVVVVFEVVVVAINEVNGAIPMTLPRPLILIKELSASIMCG